MSRELSPEELEFINQQLYNEDTVIDDKKFETIDDVVEFEEKNKKDSVKSKKKKFRIPRILGPRTWAIFFFIVPFLVSTAFLYIILQIPAAFGGIQSLDFIDEIKKVDDWEQVINEIGLDWLPQFLVLYDNKELIIGGIFTLFFIISAIFLTWDILSRRRSE